MKNFDRIERYLRGEMDEQERPVFEQELREDPALKKELEVQRFERALIEEAFDEKLRRDIQRAMAGDDEPRFRLRLLPAAAIAAGVAAILAAALWLWHAAQPVGPVAVAKQAYLENAPKFQDISRSLRGAGQREELSPIAETVEKLGQNDEATLAIARDSLLAVPATNQEAYELAQYYAGHAYYKLGEYQLAFEQFRRAGQLENLDIELRQAADYFALLSAIASGEPPEVYAPLLEKILSNPNHRHLKKTRKLQEKLK